MDSLTPMGHATGSPGAGSGSQKREGGAWQLQQQENNGDSSTGTRSLGATYGLQPPVGQPCHTTQKKSQRHVHRTPRS